MITFDEAALMLDELAEEFPQEFYEDLNGGVYLLPGVKKHPESRGNRPLYILGEFISRHDMGKYINIYYGSFTRVYGHCSPGESRQALRRILAHEFTHHLEFLAGERDLEIKDDADMEKYRNGTL
ncbi:MAG: metallopeptidase family protein [Oscillospiraceae bacterium]|jgi:hypothetical protein|nr:metallopeptidase family protein [Oscillospiraceae bacterium]